MSDQRTTHPGPFLSRKTFYGATVIIAFTTSSQSQSSLKLSVLMYVCVFVSEEGDKSEVTRMLHIKKKAHMTMDFIISRMSSFSFWLLNSSRTREGMLSDKRKIFPGGKHL
jgi:hypothetical protein